MWGTAFWNKLNLSLCVAAMLCSFLWGVQQVCGGPSFFQPEGPACSVEHLAPMNPAGANTTAVPAAVQDAIAFVLVVFVSIAVHTRPSEAALAPISNAAGRAARCGPYKRSMRIPYLCPTNGP